MLSKVTIQAGVCHSGIRTYDYIPNVVRYQTALYRVVSLGRANSNCRPFAYRAERSNQLSHGPILIMRGIFTSTNQTCSRLRDDIYAYAVLPIAGGLNIWFEMITCIVTTFTFWNHPYFIVFVLLSHCFL